jgi:hypothetical protein
MTLFNAIDVIDTQDDLSAFMKYVGRIDASEAQAVFFTMVAQSSKTVRLAKNNKQISDWSAKNFQLLI